jgi:hypothetical protein
VDHAMIRALNKGAMARSRSPARETGVSLTPTPYH